MFVDIRQLRPEQNSRDFVDNTFTYILWNGTEFSFWEPIDNISELVQVMVDNAARHYLHRCCPIALTQYVVTRP